MLNLSLSGCGFLGIYHVGVISAFKEHGDPCFLEKISGCSAGSLVAACALCECCLGRKQRNIYKFNLNYANKNFLNEIQGQMVSDVLEIAMKARSHALGPLHPSFNIVEILKNGLRRYYLSFNFYFISVEYNFNFIKKEYFQLMLTRYVRVVCMFH